jgi:hypothetical protein
MSDYSNPSESFLCALESTVKEQWLRERRPPDDMHLGGIMDTIRALRETRAALAAEKAAHEETRRGYAGRGIGDSDIAELFRERDAAIARAEKAEADIRVYLEVEAKAETERDELRAERNKLCVALTREKESKENAILNLRTERARLAELEPLRHKKPRNTDWTAIMDDNDRLRACVADLKARLATVERETLERAAEAMNPILRSMLSRGDAARIIRALADKGEKP